MIDGVEFELVCLFEFEDCWIGQCEVFGQLLVVWICIDELDWFFNLWLFGLFGVGKMIFVLVVVCVVGFDFYIMQGMMDMCLEDFVVVLVFDWEDSSWLCYVVLLFVMVMICGVVCVFDEGNCMSEKFWVSLVLLFDYWCYVESQVVGLCIEVYFDFWFVMMMNCDVLIFEIFEFIYLCFMLQIVFDFLDEYEECVILKLQVLQVDEDVFDFLFRVYNVDLCYIVCDGINVVCYVLKMLCMVGEGGLDVKEVVEEVICLVVELVDFDFCFFD